MLNIKERELKRLLDSQYQKGINHGIELMKQKILHAYKNGNPISIEGRVYFIKSDIENLRNIFADLEIN
ncbi:hypothetical protein [Lacrimispora sp.]|uniref:hypothetical protein n=1 Tax=Lacrimispora sp. TaxID=2719234 RepID=UPI0028A9B0AE|nr:hypothetical protein [Lacrimispora sp.]